MSAWMEHFHFLRPLWLLALAGLPLLLWQWRRRRDAADPWRRACDAHLLPHLLQSGDAAGGRWAPWLFSLGYAIAVIALAGPAFRQLPEPLSRNDSALVIALDLSDRMRSTDLKPDRVSRARFKLADLLEARDEGQTALIAYAGDAFTVAPLTDDAKSLGDLLASLGPDTMPVPGQRPDRAIELANRLLHDAGYAEGRLLLVTDRADARAHAAAEAARAAGLSTFVLGVGTPQATPIPLPQGGFVQDENGEVLLPHLDEASLRELASEGDGAYAALGIDGSDLAALGLAGSGAGEGKLREDERTRADYRDEGPFVLLLLLPLAALAFRRGWLAGVALMLALPAPRAEAFDFSSLWQRDDQRAYEALQQQDPARALELAKDPALRGSAAYRSEDFAQAASAFAQGDDADAHYNRGNALAQSKQYEQAIAEYDRALALQPGMEDALANKQAVEDFLKQQQEKQEEQEPQDSQGDPGEEGDPQESQESQDSEQQQGEDSEQQQGKPSERQGDPQASDDASGDPQEQQQQQAEEDFRQQMEQALEEGKEQQEAQEAQEVDPREAEKQQAVEQWLRRVPDDPGGLLRRKFALEYQRRLREDQGDRP